MIKIETRKDVTNKGVCVREITGFKLLPYSKLPELYRNSDLEAVYENKNKIVLNNKTEYLYSTYSLGERISEEEFQLLIKFCHKAGDNLKAVNARLKALREEWQGQETFCI